MKETADWGLMWWVTSSTVDPSREQKKEERVRTVFHFLSPECSPYGPAGVCGEQGSGEEKVGSQHDYSAQQPINWPQETK